VRGSAIEYGNPSEANISERIHLTTIQLGSPRTRNEGLRIGTVRLLPRGVRKTDYAKLDYFDVWLPQLAPSRELLSQFKHGKITTRTLFSRYRTEMNNSEPRQLIRLLAEVARRTPIAVGCYCEDESKCHRFVLGELIRQAANN